MILIHTQSYRIIPNQKQVIIMWPNFCLGPPRANVIRPSLKIHGAWAVGSLGWKSMFYMFVGQNYASEHPKKPVQFIVGVSDLQTIISIFSKSENGLFPTLGVQWPCTCTWPGCSKSLHATRLDIESICDGWNLEARCQLPLRMCCPYTGKGCPDRQEKRSSFPSYYNFDVGQLCPWM